MTIQNEMVLLTEVHYNVYIRVNSIAMVREENDAIPSKRK